MKLDSTNQKNFQKFKQLNKKPWESNPNWIKKQKKHYKQKLCIHCRKNDYIE